MGGFPLELWIGLGRVGCNNVGGSFIHDRREIQEDSNWRVESVTFQRETGFCGLCEEWLRVYV